MRTGKLRHFRAIEMPSDGSAWGGTQTWTTFAEAWMSIEPIRGREFFAGEATNSEVTHRIRMRYLSGVRPNMRINHGGRYLRFESVQNVEERNRELEIMAREVVE